MAVVFIIGCAGLPETTRTGAIHSIRIEKTLSDQNLTVQIGDEIRWVNYRTGSVIIEFVPEAIGSFSCENGFSNMFGKFKTSTRLGQGEAASLCFSKSGEYKYNARDCRSSWRRNYYSRRYNGGEVSPKTKGLKRPAMLNKMEGE